MSDKIIIKIDDYLFDVTEYANNHPGGYNILKKLNNKDATEEFNSIKGHSDISPGRKSDPGDKFEWNRYINQL